MPLPPTSTRRGQAAISRPVRLLTCSTSSLAILTTPAPSTRSNGGRSSRDYRHVLMPPQDAATRRFPPWRDDGVTRIGSPMITSYRRHASPAAFFAPPTIASDLPPLRKASLRPRVISRVADDEASSRLISADFSQMRISNKRATGRFPPIGSALADLATKRAGPNDSGAAGRQPSEIACELSRRAIPVGSLRRRGYRPPRRIGAAPLKLRSRLPMPAREFRGRGHDSRVTGRCLRGC